LFGPGGSLMPIAIGATHVGDLLPPIHIELTDLFFDGHAQEEVFDAAVDGQMRVFIRGPGVMDEHYGWNDQETTDGNEKFFAHTTSI
jgi:hypothetical protein